MSYEMNDIKSYMMTQQKELLKKAHLVQSDGGRESAGFAQEFNDCVVRALSIAYCAPYAEIHEELRKLGRKTGKGFSTAFAMCKRSFVWHKSQSELHMTVGRFLREHPVGHYVITVKGHAMGVVDGVIHDKGMYRPNRHVLNAWKVL